MRNIAPAMAAMTILIALSGCGAAAEEIAESAIESESGSDVELDIDEDGDQVSIETDDASMTFGGGELPDDLGIPVPDGGAVLSTLETSTSAGVQRGATIEYESGRFDDLRAYYTDWVGDLEATKSEISGDDGRTAFWAIPAHPDLGEVSISIIETSDEVLLSVGSTG